MDGFRKAAWRPRWRLTVRKVVEESERAVTAWQETVARVLEALREFPEARLAVVAALEPRGGGPCG